MSKESKYIYSREYLLNSDITLYRNMLRQHKVGSPEYLDISNELTKLKKQKDENRKRFPSNSPYFSRGKPSVKMALRVSKKQKILDELYQEKEALKQKIYNIELEIETLDKRIKLVRSSHKRK